MNPKSSAPGSFYRLTGLPDGTRQRVESRPTTAGPWSLDAQHGGPPAALLGRAIEALGAGTVGRFTMDLLGPVPVGELDVSASVVRPGRSVSLAHASLHDVTLDRPVATASSWLFPRSEHGAGHAGPPPGHTPSNGTERARPQGWSAGYLDTVEWRWITGGLDTPGTGSHHPGAGVGRRRHGHGVRRARPGRPLGAGPARATPLTRNVIRSEP